MVFLDFLNETLKRLCQADVDVGGHGLGPEALAQWMQKDAELLAGFLTGTQKQLKADHVFAIQRIHENQVQIVVASSIGKDEDPPEHLREFIQDLLDHEKLGILQDSAMVVVRTGDPRQGKSMRTRPSRYQRIFPCQVGDKNYGFFGAYFQCPRHKAALTKQTTILANQLGFWFAHLFHLRMAEIKRRILQKINMTISVLTSSVNLSEIIGHMIEDLNLLFGQRSGAVFLSSRETGGLEVNRIFGEQPESFDLAAFLNSKNPMLDSLADGAAKFGSDEEGSQPIRVVFPLITTAQKGSLFNDPDGNHQQNLLGGVVLFRSPSNKPITQDDRELLGFLVNGVSAALLVTLNYQEKLETIQALEGLMGKLSDKDYLFTEMIEIIRRLLKVNRISFLTLEPDGQHLRIQKSYGLPSGVAETTRIPIGEEISGHVVSSRKSLRLDNIEASEKFHKRSLERYFNRSLLSVPLLGHGLLGEGTVLGVINVNNKTNGLTFTEQDQQLLEAIAHLVVVTIENMSLLQEKHKKDQMQLQLDLAKEVQTRLLPKSFPDIFAAFDMFGRSDPAQQIGGDFFDGLHLEDRRWLAAVGDVSGKGIHAALLMATTRILLRSAVHETSDLGKILSLINDRLSKEIEEMMFVTMQIVAIDPATGKAEIASAGHGPLVARLAGQVAMLKGESAFPLGMAPLNQSYGTTPFRMAPGDSFLLFSDGLYDEKSPQGERFGFKNTETMFARLADLSPKPLVEQVFQTIQAFRGENEASDDLTVVSLAYRGM